MEVHSQQGQARTTFKKDIYKKRRAKLRNDEEIKWTKAKQSMGREGGGMKETAMEEKDKE